MPNHYSKLSEHQAAVRPSRAMSHPIQQPHRENAHAAANPGGPVSLTVLGLYRALILLEALFSARPLPQLKLWGRGPWGCSSSISIWRPICPCSFISETGFYDGALAKLSQMLMFKDIVCATSTRR
jgi:hypothetical protein